MVIKSFGCSFIYGSDLSDDPNGVIANGIQLASYQTWPALIAKHHTHHYQCYAQPGVGNLRILDTILQQCAVTTDALFIIGWSWIDRFDFHDGRNQWDCIRPGSDNDVNKFYYKNLHSELRDKLVNLVYIKTAIDSLLQTQTPFIMTYIDDLLFDTKWHTTPAIIDLQNYIRPYTSTFNGLSFLEWSRKHEYEISPNWHPMDAAHRAAANLILDNLSQYIKNG